MDGSRKHSLHDPDDSRKAKRAAHATVKTFPPCQVEGKRQASGTAHGSDQRAKRTRCEASSLDAPTCQAAVQRALHEFRQGLRDLGKNSRYLDELAMAAKLDTAWEAEGCGGKNLDHLLKDNGLYDKGSIHRLLEFVSQTTLLETSPVVKAAVALFVAYGNPTTNLPGRLKVQWHSGIWS